MPNNSTAYISYFRGLAVSHHLLRHDPASETGDSGIGKQTFAIWTVEEVLGNIRSKISFPALLIEMYEVDLSAESVYDIRQRPKGAFTVLVHADPKALHDQYRAYDVAEEITYDLLQKIWQDHYGPASDRCTTPFKQFRFTGTIIPTGMMNNNDYGYRVEFEFDLQNTVDIKQAPPAGIFI